MDKDSPRVVFAIGSYVIFRVFVASSHVLPLLIIASVDSAINGHRVFRDIQDANGDIILFTFFRYSCKNLSKSDRSVN